MGLRHVGSAWVLRHYRAASEPEPINELPLALLIEGAMRYFQNNPDLVKDYVLYPKFCDMIEGMRGLLCGDVGRFDQGTLDCILYEMSKEATDEHPVVHVDEEPPSGGAA
jgi:hypothetical protein